MSLLNSLFTSLTEKTNKSWRLYNFFSKTLPTPTRNVRGVGIKVIIPLHQEGVWTSFKKWESREVETLDWIDTFEPSSVFFDVGASFGNETLYAALKAHGPRDIVCFDIDLLSSYNLACNIAINNIKNVTQYYLPLGSGHDIMTAAEPTQYLALASQGVAKINYNLFTISLDEFIEKTSKHPTYIKIDVDGAEVHVLRGMENTLKNVELKSLLIEVSRETEDEVIGILARNNFEKTFSTPYVGHTNTSNIIFCRKAV